MGNDVTRTRHSTAWLWWALSALLVVAVVVDAIDGEPLKLITSSLLLAASLLAASTRAPRSKAVIRLATGLVGLAIVVLAYRLAGPGL